jgi:hypothetical protein
VRLETEVDPLPPFGPAPLRRQVPRYNGHSLSNIGRRVLGEAVWKRIKKVETPNRDLEFPRSNF